MLNFVTVYRLAELEAGSGEESQSEMPVKTTHLFEQSHLKRKTRYMEDYRTQEDEDPRKLPDEVRSAVRLGGRHCTALEVFPQDLAL
jgi:hypothetical protein